MLKSIKSFFDNLSPASSQSEEEKQHAIHLAVAVLLVEMGRMDGDVSQSEIKRINTVLSNQFLLTDQEKQEITELAEDKLDDSVDYYQFTSVINQHFSQSEKIKVVENLWEIAFADGKLNAHEEHFLRKIHSLLHVSHSNFMKTKHTVKSKLTS